MIDLAYVEAKFSLAEISLSKRIVIFSFVVFQGNSVTIAINHVSLESDSHVLTNDSIRQLFVEYKFLGIEPQETETPFSLPKPKPYHTIQFNFSKSEYSMFV